MVLCVPRNRFHPGASEGGYVQVAVRCPLSLFELRVGDEQNILKLYNLPFVCLMFDHGGLFNVLLI